MKFHETLHMQLLFINGQRGKGQIEGVVCGASCHNRIRRGTVNSTLLDTQGLGAETGENGKKKEILCPVAQ